MSDSAQQWEIREEDSREEGFSVYRNHRVIEYGAVDVRDALRRVKRTMGSGFSVTLIDRDGNSSKVKT